MFYYFSKFLPLFIYPLGLACVLLVCVIFIKKESPWVKRLAICALLILFLGGNGLVKTFVIRHLEKQYPPLEVTPSADVILVLGGGTRHLSPPRLEHEINEAGDRLLYAARLYHQGAAPRILVSGGNAKWVGPETGSESIAMKDILILAGVPDDAIILETLSANTYDNAVNSVEIMDNLEMKHAILITSAMHMPRAMGIFKKLNQDVIPAPTDFQVTDEDITYAFSTDLRVQIINLLPTAHNLEWLSRALKEYIGILAYHVRGWI